MTETMEAIVLEALRDCYDPELPCNVVDLGVVTDILITPDPHAPGSGIPGVPPRFHASVTVTPTSATEEAEAHLRAQIGNRLAGLEALSHAVVHVSHDPVWTPLRILPAGRRALGLDGNRSLVQIR